MASGTSVSDTDEAAEAEDIEDAVVEIDDPPPAPRRWVRPLIRGAVAALFVAALIWSGVAGWMLFSAHQRDSAGREALSAAEGFAIAFTNADPSTIDQRIDEVTKATTGDFRERYVKNISKLRAMLIDNKVTTHGSIVDSAVTSAGTGTVKVLLLVKQSFVSADTPAPPAGAPAPPAGAPAPPADLPAEVVAMAITVQKVEGHWLVSKVVPGDQL